MIRKMYCIETDKNSLYVDKDVYDYIVSLEQQCIKQKEAINKAIEWVKDWRHGANDWFEEDSKPSELLDILNEVSE